MVEPHVIPSDRIGRMTIHHFSPMAENCDKFRAIFYQAYSKNSTSLTYHLISKLISSFLVFGLFKIFLVSFQK